MSPRSSVPPDRTDGSAPAERPVELLPWAGLLLLAVWTVHSNAWWLLASGAAVIGAALPPRGRGRADAVSLVLLLVAVATGFVAHQRLASIDRDFDGYWARREAAVAGVLDRELADLLEAGESAATVLAENADLPEPDRHPSIADVRMRYGLTAAALYDSDGRLVVWDGTHQGTVPDPVRVGSVPYAYADRPLFSHLYFTEPLPNGQGTAMVAALLSSDLPLELGAETGDFASRIRSRTGEELRLSRAELAAGEGIWDLRLGEETLFSVAVARPAEAARLEQVRDRWAGAVGALVLAGWVMLAIAGRGVSGHVAVAATALAGLGLLLPFDSVLGSPGLFAPGAFVLPGPFDLPLGRLLVVALAGALGAGLIAGSVRAPFPAWVAGAAVAVLFPVVTALVRAGASHRLPLGWRRGSRGLPAGARDPSGPGGRWHAPRGRGIRVAPPRRGHSDGRARPRGTALRGGRGRRACARECSVGRARPLEECPHTWRRWYSDAGRVGVATCSGGPSPSCSAPRQPCRSPGPGGSNRG